MSNLDFEPNYVTNMQQMTTHRPYLVRAFYDWIVDNGMTPYIVVDAGFDGVEVPHEYVVDGEIVLNLAPSAIRHLDLGLEYITFDARFSGKSLHILIPVEAVYAIYAKESGEGRVFTLKHHHVGGEQDDAMQADALPNSVGATDSDLPARPAPGRPNLRVVK